MPDGYVLRLDPSSADSLVAPDGSVVAEYDDLRADGVEPRVDMIDHALEGYDVPAELRAAFVAIATGIDNETVGTATASTDGREDA